MDDKDGKVSTGMDAGGCDLGGDLLDGLVGPSRWHRSIVGDKMVAIREGLEVSQALFAAQCGHSQVFQVQIERPGVHEITTDKAKDIITAISFYK